MAGETQFGNVNDLFAIGMSAARTGNVRTAQMVQQALAQRSTAPQEGDMRPAISIMEREMAAVIELAGGRTENAVEILKSAARSELDLPAPLGLPAPIKPAPELLGEVLLEAGRAAEAAPHFESVLQLHANRALSVLGRARAAAASGDTAVAHQRYSELLANYDHADSDVVEVQEARAALANNAGIASPGRPWLVWAFAGAVSVVAFISYRRRQNALRQTKRAAPKGRPLRKTRSRS
jgi:hypothetical protein